MQHTQPRAFLDHSEHSGSYQNEAEVTNRMKRTGKPEP